MATISAFKIEVVGNTICVTNFCNDIKSELTFETITIKCNL